jgi:mannitol/fructose-specific phosphotransferase system IIA component (Ntr-type)
VFTFKGQDVADTILRFAKEYRVGQIVIGKPHRIPWWKRLKGDRSVAEELIHRARGVTIVVIDAEADGTATPEVEVAKSSKINGEKRAGVISALTPPLAGLDGYLSEKRVVVLDDALSRSDVMRRLVDAIAVDVPSLDATDVLRRLEEREREGSTFLNEGVALPHARVPGLTEPQVALAVTKAGVLDAPTTRPIEVVFLLLSPAEQSATHLQLLAKAGRSLQNREMRRTLLHASTPREALAALHAV